MSGKRNAMNLARHKGKAVLSHDGMRHMVTPTPKDVARWSKSQRSGSDNWPPKLSDILGWRRLTLKR